MRQRKFRYAVDTDQFQRIREDGKVYVDKTDFIYNLAHSYQYVFLARPRRFGKSLLCNTFKAYFQGQKELFEGLKIMELEKEWEKYPVLHFDISEIKNCSSLDGMREVLSVMIGRYEKAYGLENKLTEPGLRFGELLRHINATTGKQVVAIFDEYDAPMMQYLHEPQMLREIRLLLRGIYQRVKMDGALLKFVFITGVTKFSQLSIFSELNNLNQISMLDEFSGICGITQNELDTVLRPCVEEYAENMEITTEEAYELLKKNYDGYHFSRNSEDVYAPFSLLRALNNNTTDYYWFESSTMSALIEHLKHFDIKDALEYDGVDVSDDEFNISCESASTPLPLLYQSGYLSIDKYCRETGIYTLHFPNLEVRNGMVRGLMPLILRQTPREYNSMLIKMVTSLYQGNLSDALLAIRAYIAKIPYDIITKEEWEDKESRESFYKLLIYMVFSILQARVDTEVKSILGRADVVIQTKNDVFVLELKVDKSVDEALAQIDSKEYAIQYTADGRKITKCGISISTEARNIIHWRSVSEDGVVIDEQDFRQRTE